MSTVGQLPRITPSEAMAKIREGALAVDIRSQAEYRGGHIGGALSLPPEQQRDKLPDDTAPCLIFYCLSGKRTTRAETILSALGQGRECYILEGGLLAWKAAELPCRTGYHTAGANHCGQFDSIGRAGRLAGITLVLSDRRDGRRRPVNCRTNRILRHGSPAGQNAMEPLSKGRLKVAAEAIMTDNSTSSFAEKREK